MQQIRTPTSDDRMDAHDMESYQRDVTRGSGANRQQQDGNDGQQGSSEPNARNSRLR
jgi:hypothetical protein